jgi:hypothetical protein
MDRISEYRTETISRDWEGVVIARWCLLWPKEKNPVSEPDEGKRDPELVSIVIPLMPLN